MNQKFEELVERVYKKTEDGAIEWAEDAFEVGLGNRVLMVFRRYTSHDNHPYIGVTLFDEAGRVIENETFPEDLDFGSSRAEDLYRLARSKARNSEQAIDELLRELSESVPPPTA